MNTLFTSSIFLILLSMGIFAYGCFCNDVIFFLGGGALIVLSLMGYMSASKEQEAEKP